MKRILLFTTLLSCVNMLSAQDSGAKNAKYTEYPEAGHNSWDNAFAEPDLLPWLFAQKK
ncbi:MAG TPA: hypothetical protein VFC34_12130 [Puia sp.]|nr:hypothetical protein [Puia sp.]